MPFFYLVGKKNRKLLKTRKITNRNYKNWKIYFFFFGYLAIVLLAFSLFLFFVCGSNNFRTVFGIFLIFFSKAKRKCFFFYFLLFRKATPLNHPPAYALKNKYLFWRSKLKYTFRWNYYFFLSLKRIFKHLV